ncbi:hypothetical protein ABZS29_18360 [Kribbella sp. NPDC005582]|uniref:hypothetical protein n=1 Tax=Kribbella sp. NPDC005582 TaxID=3156893 RepID=UPI0033AC07B5
MNLTTPPPVERLDPEYAAELKHHLVRTARKRRRTPYVAWVPIVAATAAIAVSITTVVVLSRSGGADPAGPAGVMQVAPSASDSESIELGKASEAEARAAAQQCLTVRKNAYGVETHPGSSADAKTAALRSARWIRALGVPGKSKQLLQTFVVTHPDNELLWYQCLDGELLRWAWYFDDFGRTIGFDGSSPIPGTWGWSDIGKGKSAGVRASYSFRAADNVDRVELRIRGVDSVSPWYAERVADHGGYVAGTLAGAAAEHGKAEIDVRAVGKDGKQLWFTTFG